MYKPEYIDLFFKIKKEDLFDFINLIDESIPIEKDKIQMRFTGYEWIKNKDNIFYDFSIIKEFLAIDELDGYSCFVLENEIDLYTRELIDFNILKYGNNEYFITLSYFNNFNFQAKYSLIYQFFINLLQNVNIIYFVSGDSYDQNMQSSYTVNNGIFADEVRSGGTLGWGAEERFQNWGAAMTPYSLHFAASFKMYFGKAMGEIVPIHLIENFEFAQKCFEFNQELIKIELFEPKDFDNYKLIRERQKKFWLELDYKKHILIYLDKIKKDDAYLYNLYLELKKKKRYKRLGI
jgi:hypothetical protein